MSDSVSEERLRLRWGPEEEVRVGVLSRFERRLGGLVEGAFAKVFKGGVEPVELAGALREETDSRRVISATRTLVPNDFLIELSGRDHEHLVPYEQALATELAEIIKDHAADQRYTFVGNVRVRFARNDSLDTGIFTVSSGVIGPAAGAPGRPGWPSQVPHGARPAAGGRPGRWGPVWGRRWPPHPCRTHLRSPRHLMLLPRPRPPGQPADLWARPPGPPGEGAAAPRPAPGAPPQGGDPGVSAPGGGAAPGGQGAPGAGAPPGAAAPEAGWVPAGQPGRPQPGQAGQERLGKGSPGPMPPDAGAGMAAPGGWNAIPGRPRLLVAAAGDEGPQGGLIREYAIEGDHVLVGRTAESTIRLTDTRVSRRHGEITRLAGAANGMDVYLYRDLDSTNGSLVNGQRVSRAELRDGDQIQLGSTTLVFRVDPLGYRGYGPGQR